MLRHSFIIPARRGVVRRYGALVVQVLLKSKSRRAFAGTVDVATDHNVPVVLLSGFLGAGKTTVLERLLKGDHGKRLGVIVNDLAAVNVDAAVLETALQESGARSVALANGCVCCSAQEDLVQGVKELISGTGASELDAVVVELSGVAEPHRARGTLEWGLAKPGRPPPSVRTVALVDSPAFAMDYMAAHQDDEPPPQRDADGCERVGTLLAEQIEAADLILLSKTDVATDAQVAQAKALTESINEHAEVRTIKHGNVDPDLLLSSRKSLGKNIQICKQESCGHAHAHDHSHGHDHGHSHSHGEDGASCSDPSHDHSSVAEKRFGIKSFVYTVDRPFSHGRLVDVLQHWQAARKASSKQLHLPDVSSASVHHLENAKPTDKSPFLPILRSKGMLWLDSHPRDAFYWSHAGLDVKFSMWGPWPPSEGGFGEPRSEIVFIGAGVEETKIRTTLDACLLTDRELKSMGSITARV